MPLVIAIIIIVLFAFASIKFRAYACFNLIILGISAILAANMGGDSIFSTIGWASLITGLVIMLATAMIQVEKSRRVGYMVRLFLYGMLLFLQVMLTMLIITIPLVNFTKEICKDYKERIVVDCYGNEIGKVYVDENLKGADGKQYSNYDNPY